MEQGQDKDQNMLDHKITMNTVSQILEKLRQKKYDNEFCFEKEGLTIGKGKFYQPEDLTIIKTYRFEGESDPSDMAILYIIEANDGLMGYSLDAYGTYSDHGENALEFNNFIRQIPIKDRDEQLIFEV